LHLQLQLIPNVKVSIATDPSSHPFSFHFRIFAKSCKESDLKIVWSKCMMSRLIFRGVVFSVFLLSAGVSTRALAGRDPLSQKNQVPVACEKDMSFERWVDGLQQEALASGISQAAVQAALPFLTFDADIIRRDRAQSVFQQTFLQFSDRMATAYRMKKGRKLIKENQDLFDRIERQFGVPASVIVSFWALESDFGVNTGKYQILSALATLAYDCRRPDFFRPQLLDALRLIDRGDLPATQMIGNWAGELGATQFAPSGYFKFGVDFDGDRRVDLKTSVPDTLATTANFLLNQVLPGGWHRGEPWLQEVRVPDQMPWEEADLAIQHSVDQWARWGVKPATGVLPQGYLQASLILPMGRMGPAFLAYPNFQAFLGWNAAMVYSTTAAYLALRIDGAPAIGRGKQAVVPLTAQEMTELQTLLAGHGYEVGVIDGKMGSGTRAAVKKAQLRYRLPADSYPTLELLDLLRGN
jgi:lytic murein transglycosylase